MLNFEYRHWAGWGIGSSATFSADILPWDLRFTLVVRDGKTVVLDAVHVVPSNTLGIPLGKPPEIVLSSDPEAARSKGRKRKTRTPVEKIVLPSKEPDPPPLQPLAEGNEIVDALGEEFLCRWIERRGILYSRQYTVKTWISEKVPGGIVRVEGKYPSLAGIPSSWVLKACERKSV